MLYDGKFAARIRETLDHLPKMDEIVLEKAGCKRIDLTGKPKKSLCFCIEEGMKTAKTLSDWINLCLDFNSKAKVSKKKKKNN